MAQKDFSEVTRLREAGGFGEEDCHWGTGGESSGVSVLPVPELRCVCEGLDAPPVPELRM